MQVKKVIKNESFNKFSGLKKHTEIDCLENFWTFVFFSLKVYYAKTIFLLGDRYVRFNHFFIKVTGSETHKAQDQLQICNISIYVQYIRDHSVIDMSLMMKSLELMSDIKEQ